MKLKGIVKIGENSFSYWIEKLEHFYFIKTGLHLFPGTLNVHLIDDYFSTPPKDTIIRLEKEEYSGQVSVNIIECRIFDRKAYILRTDTDTGKFGEPPEKILEIATDIPLRRTFNLKDGDIVEVEIPGVYSEMVSKSNIN